MVLDDWVVFTRLKHSLPLCRAELIQYGVYQYNTWILNSIATQSVELTLSNITSFQ